MQIVQTELERDGRAFLAYGLVGLLPDFLHDLFDPRRVDAAVRDEALNCQLRDLTPVGVEPGQDDGPGRVVDDEIDPGRELERPDVPALAPDDAAFQIVAREIHDRHGGLDRVLGGRSLNGLGDVLLGPVGGEFTGLGVEPLHQVRRVVPRLALDLLEQQLLGFVGSEARDALELVLLLRDQAFEP